MGHVMYLVRLSSNEGLLGLLLQRPLARSANSNAMVAMLDPKIGDERGVQAFAM